MGDNLAQLLFETLQARGPELPPFRRVAWSELDVQSQEDWKAVANTARKELTEQFKRDMRDAVIEYGAAGAIENLLVPEAN